MGKELTVAEAIDEDQFYQTLRSYGDIGACHRELELLLMRLTGIIFKVKIRIIVYIYRWMA